MRCKTNKTVLRYVEYGCNFILLRNGKKYKRLKQHLFNGRPKQRFDCFDFDKKCFCSLSMQSHVEVIYE